MEPRQLGVQALTFDLCSIAGRPILVEEGKKPLVKQGSRKKLLADQLGWNYAENGTPKKEPLDGQGAELQPARKESGTPFYMTTNLALASEFQAHINEGFHPMVTDLPTSNSPMCWLKEELLL
jgi:hypothetical protein